MAILRGMMVLATLGCCLVTSAGGRRSSVDPVDPVVSTNVRICTGLLMDDLPLRLPGCVTL
jgi:hypothetical protein